MLQLWQVFSLHIFIRSIPENGHNFFEIFYNLLYHEKNDHARKKSR